MISFEIDGELELFRGAARTFAEQVLRPAARGGREVLPQLLGPFRELGLSGLDLPEEVGGLAQGLMAKVVVEEELAAGDLGQTVALSTPGAFGTFVQRLGTQEQAQRILTPLLSFGRRGAVAWSEAHPRVGSFQTTAVETDDGGFRLDGEKIGVRFAEAADVFLVFARVERRSGERHLGALVVPARPEERPAGLTVTPWDKELALDEAPSATVSFAGVVVPPSARLAGADSDFDVRVLDALARIGLVGAAREVGLARVAAETAQHFAAEREAFGKPIAHFQAIAFTVADLMTRVEVMRGLVHRAAFAFDQGEPDALRRAAYAIAEAHEGVMAVTNHAVQIHGGAGFVQDYPVEKWMREAKAHMSHAWPHGVADLLVGRLALEGQATLTEDGPLPELQPIWL